MGPKKKRHLIRVEIGGDIRYFTIEELRVFLVENFGAEFVRAMLKGGNLAKQTGLEWTYENGSWSPRIGKG